MHTLVIGGSGFLGTYIVEALLRRGHRVAVLTRKPEAAAKALPPEVSLLQGDLAELDESALHAMLKGFDKLVFAAGADERSRPDTDARSYFFRENVDTLKKLLLAARQTSISHTVVLNSIFTCVDRAHPELALADTHPYIASRIAQSETALQLADGHFTQTVLEIPWVFGDSRGRTSQWAPLVHYARSAVPLLSPEGGTIAIPARNVGEAAAGALQRDPAGGNLSLPIGDGQLSWDDLLLKFASLGGRKHAAITRLPSPLFAKLNGLGAVSLRLLRQPMGLDFARMHEFLLMQLDADLVHSQQQLGYSPDSISDALSATVQSVHEPLPLRSWRKLFLNRSLASGARVIAAAPGSQRAA